MFLQSTFLLTWSALLAGTIFTSINLQKKIKSKQNANANVTQTSKKTKILALDLVIHVIAFLFYTYIIFVSQFKSYRNLRYLDWTLTTPLLLYILVVFANERINGVQLTGIFTLLFLMLFCGWVGENTFSTSYLLGFLFFVALFAYLYRLLFHVESDDAVVENKRRVQKNKKIKMVFLFSAVVWGLYGAAYLLNYKLRNIMYNILDLISKVIFGIWVTFIEL